MSTVFDLRGRTVLVTGAGRGIGRALTLGAAASGAMVGALDVDSALLQALMSDAGSQSQHIMPLHADALIHYEPIEQVGEAMLDRMLAIGIKGAVWGAQALLAHMDPARGAVLINMSSPVAERGFPGTSVYAMTKAAMASLTRTLAAELGPRGVRTCALAPGSVPTPGAVALTTPAEYQRRVATIPLRRLGREEDCTASLLFLLSSEAAFINGAILHVDGGILAAG
jgi:meso-butanediol dehydrogenase / (S,S)-butanediol dehydrogenase / diacetyl reductase